MAALEGARRVDCDHFGGETMANYVRFKRKDGATGAGLLEGTSIAVVKEPFWDNGEPPEIYPTGE